ncbi:DUF1294 domain-containing protein [Rodentibacter myodis]|uniref:DUF1294 domain-containing protein n=1 Tax=Rodentibacter myodis TaxID=1907939 RepID=A0A1V3JTH0_9PAST|nr:DUF1294 domain-containing protein [Rodentibacter myodis]OOF60065.1 hypothetical protein BKL49_00945 [Rodentibacter myodis]
MLFFLFILWLAAVNIAAYFLMWKDKIRAIHHKWRIPEKTFFFLCFLGGFMGVHCAMERFRHKTQHFSFKLMIAISAFWWVVGLPCLLLYFYKVR